MEQRKRVFGARGQTATEYLIILAVVIIIALVAVSVLGGFPTLFTSRSGEMLSEAYWQSEKISIYQHRISGTEGRFYLQNKLRFPIEVSEMKLDEISLTDAAGRVIPSGGSVLVTGTGFDCRKGDKYAHGVMITYKYADTNEGPFEFNGIKKLISTCQ